MPENFYLAAMQGCNHMGGAMLRQLMDRFESAMIVWMMDEGTLREAKILPEKALQSFLAVREERPYLPEELHDACTKQGIKICTMYEAEYPPLLKEIHNPPVVLFYKGQLQNDRPRVAMVGARKATAYGRAAAEKIGAELAAAGISVVSGAAAGIDACSHKGALLKGTTEAVLGCGVDIAYPQSNRKLLAEIAEKGAVISEYLPGTPPQACNFPARNRIISGMSQGTAVIEAARRSGSLITAEMALSEDRDVFALPGSVFSPMSLGCHHLIQQGAQLIIDSCDIINEYTDYRKTTECKENQENNNDKQISHVIITETEKRILNVLQMDVPLSIDEIICRVQGERVDHVAFVLLQLEFKGLVQADSLQRYVRRRNMY